jgi:hypothetical protein
METIHNQYGHLTYPSLANVFAWWPTMEKDIRAFVAACPNCQMHQQHRQTHEKEYAQLVSDQAISALGD